MTCPKLSVDVYLYDTKVVPPTWNYNERMKLELIEADHSHPHALKITAPGVGPIICPAHKLISAVKWIEKALP
jgi:hypothetical protein